MQIIKITANSNGSHNNQTIDGVIPVPEGYAVIPDSMDTTSTFPFVNITVSSGVVTSITANQAAYDAAIAVAAEEETVEA